MSSEPTYLFKVVFAGPSGVGKTSVLCQLSRGKFEKEIKTTIGVEFTTYNLTVDEDIIKLQIWDTAGRERYRAITSAYYRGAVGAILVYDITNRASFEELNKWLEEINVNADPNASIVLIGNKSDLTDKRQIDEAEAEAFAQKNGLIYLETSAKDGTGVKEAITRLVECIIRKEKEEKSLQSKPEEESVINNDSDEKRNPVVEKQYSLSIDANRMQNIRKMNSSFWEMFEIKINERSVKVPLHYAVEISSSIADILCNDRTARSAEFNISIRRKKNEDMIMSILQSWENTANVEFLDEIDMFDFAQFGIALGNEEFVNPLSTYLDEMVKSGIDESNVVEIIKTKGKIAALQDKEVDYDQEISFVASNFSAMCYKEDFREWSSDESNSDMLESIVQSDNFCLNNEDEFVRFLMRINNVYLFKYALLEFCSVQVVKEFLEFYALNDKESVLFSCLKNRLIHDYSDDLQSFDNRYNSKFLKEIKDKSPEFLATELENAKATIEKLKFPPVTEKPSNYESDVFKAAENNDLLSVQYHVEQNNFNIETKDKEGRTLLFIAAQKGFISIVRYLCGQCNANVESVAKHGKTPLYIASYENHLDVVKYLVEKCHADIEAKIEDKRDAFYISAQKGCLPIVKYLFNECHANVETKDSDGMTPLYAASYYGNLPVVQFLVKECHAKVDERANDGCTPLYAAAQKGRLSVVKYLIENCSANAEATNSKGRTPLFSASLNGHIQTVKYLVENCHTTITTECIENASANVIEYLRSKSHQ